ncbi:hypothetical protein ABIB35_001525 [Arthrobacter sp. UYP6]|uniref:hypothetical protein n=1 Tax=Arthrobacter sp. UYP6 TaxID=1756378 RepID=UPI003392DFE8
MFEYWVGLVVSLVVLWGSFFQLLSQADEFADVLPEQLSDRARQRRKLANIGVIGTCIGSFLAFFASAFALLEGAEAVEEVFPIAMTAFALVFLAATAVLIWQIWKWGLRTESGTEANKTAGSAA